MVDELEERYLAYALSTIMNRAFEQLQIGALIVNDINSFRVDQMPYGGTKQSGWGREGPRYAVEEMTEARLVVLSP